MGDVIRFRQYSAGFTTSVSQQRPPEMDTPRGVFVVAEERGATVTVPLVWEVPVA